MSTLTPSSIPLISAGSLRHIRASIGDDETRLLMIGLPNGGKTSVLTRFSKKEHALHDMGNQKFRLRNMLHEGLNITVFDVGRDAYIDPYWSEYHYDRVVGIVFVVDACEPSKMNEAKECFFSILKNEKLNKVPVLIMANKCDVEGSMSSPKIGEALELHELKRNKHHIVRTSAVSDEGIQVGFEWLVGQKFMRE